MCSSFTVMAKEEVETLVFVSNYPSYSQKRRLYLHMKSFVTPSSVLLLKYKHISNQVRRLTRLDTKQYTEHICQQYSANPKKFWRWINSSKGRRNLIPTLMHNSESVVDDAAKAEIFNHYFHSVLHKRIFQILIL